MDRHILDTMYGGSQPIDKVETVLRPVMCKDPDYIRQTGDMRWCPDPPIYAPLRSLTEADRETLRLSVYQPDQCAQMLFADVNPNYNVGEDIWGHAAEAAAAPSQMVRPLKSQREH